MFCTKIRNDLFQKRLKIKKKIKIQKLKRIQKFAQL
jgi:hypothetical protein